MPPVPTVRIPELSPRTTGLDLSLTDQIPIWISEEDKTKKVSLQDLNTFFATGGGSAHAPVVFGGEMIYIVPSGDAGTDTASIPSIAGQDFNLTRGGLPLIALLADGSNSSIAEYDVLDAGGFKLLQAGDILTLNERFKLTLFNLIGGSTGGSGSSSSGSFIKGEKIVSSNITLDPALDMNKLIQIRADTTPITLTIPSVDDIPDQSFIPIETNINNSVVAKIQSTGGQYFYFNNGSDTKLYMHPGEVLWLYRKDDGLYIINDFYRHYTEVGNPKSAYKIGQNQLLCKGQELNRADYPRLWAWVQTLGFSLVDDTTWNTAQVFYKDGAFYTSAPAAPYTTVNNPYRGCFSSGDGSLTFRLPNLMNVALRGLLSDSGSDTQRYLNKPGGFQENEVGSFVADLTIPKGNSYTGGPNVTRIGNGSANPENKTLTDLSFDTGYTETRMDNIGIYWVLNY
jgi:hypothetical protein